MKEITEEQARAILKREAPSYEPMTGAIYALVVTAVQLGYNAAVKDYYSQQPMKPGPVCNIKNEKP